MINPNLKKAYTTHMGVLTKVILASEGDVIELGAGPFSTPLLHWLCKSMKRRLISYEIDTEFYNYARQYKSKSHSIVLVKNWDDVDTKTHRGVVFIDHNPFDRRGADAVKFKGSADYIVMHDTEVSKVFSDIWQNFKYIYTWKECRPWVTVASNFKKLTNLE